MRTSLALVLPATLLLGLAAAQDQEQDLPESPADLVPDDVGDPEGLDEEQQELVPELPPDLIAQREEYFALADYDASGWISYREAREALGATRLDFALYDADKDGRVRPDEFALRFAIAVERGGGFPAPKPAQAGPPPERRTAEQLRNAYDSNLDLLLDENELSVLIEEYQFEDWTATELMLRVDLNNNRVVDVLLPMEGRRLADWLETELAPTSWNLPDIDAKTIGELFGTPVPREATLGSTHLPPLIPGPVIPFRRLDLDDDGFITTEDLLALQSPLRLDVRAGAVVAGLDLDSDGRVSLPEFLRGLQ